MMKRSMFAGLGAAAVVVAEPQSWVGLSLGEGDRARIQRAMVAIDFRGDFNELGLFVSPNVTELAHSLHIPEGRLRTLADYTPGRALWAAENDRSDVSAAAWNPETSRLIAASKSLYSVDVSSMGARSTLLAFADVDPEDAADFSGTEWVLVSDRAFIPVPDMLDSTLAKALLSSNMKVRAEANRLVVEEPDETVEKLISGVSAAPMRSHLDRLTAIFTRLASSDDIYEAKALIEKIWEEELDIPGVRVYEDFFDEQYSPNIVADIPGTLYPDAWVVIGAHYDSRSTSTTNTTLRAPGADDNGTGTVALLEMARNIKESGVRFGFGIRMIHFGAEEQGLVGSRGYARAAAERGENIVAMLNGDMLGWRIPGAPIALGMKDRNVTPWLLETCNVLSELYVPEIVVGLSASCCSDYLSFFENGFPAVGYFENLGSASDNPNYHRSSDSLETVNFEQQELLTKAWFAGLATFAVPEGSVRPPTAAL